ncbi:MAG TPA: NAD(P)-dependent alcohol dehydrogenase [Steroidobacteraceae bacterium]|nr:NAD(P)-dependent alcohol dehydrogenase [Steroidobacteraceae bacterium]
MKRRYKILGGVLGFFAVVIGAFALVVSHDSPCPAAPAAPPEPAMNAVQYHCYGGPEVLKLEQVAKPVPGDDQLLVKVHAAAVNPLDWHYMRGEPYIVRMETGIGAPASPVMGVDFSGTVEAVGGSVTRFKPGDEVFGGRNGAFAEYVLVRESRAVVLKPANISHQQAAAVPVAGITALQALRDQGGLEAGQKVLINGASGGVGTYAVQIAKAMGAEVTGVCSTRNVELVRSLGADHVVDYKSTDYTAGDQEYDLIIDNIGNRRLRDNRKVLAPQGVYVIVGAPSDDPWIGALSGPIRASAYAPFVDQQLKFFVASMNPEDLGYLAGLMQSGKLVSAIDRSYPLAETAQAIEYLETGRARGKVVITIQ